jgi:hypothetical protein
LSFGLIPMPLSTILCLTNTMKYSPHWEANPFSHKQEFGNVLWKPVSEKPATFPYPEPDKSCPHHPSAIILLSEITRHNFLKKF